MRITLLSNHQFKTFVDWVLSNSCRHTDTSLSTYSIRIHIIPRIFHLQQNEFWDSSFSMISIVTIVVSLKSVLSVLIGIGRLMLQIHESTCTLLKWPYPLKKWKQQIKSFIRIRTQITSIDTRLWEKVKGDSWISRSIFKEINVLCVLILRLRSKNCHYFFWSLKYL